jgi:anti-sigma regulatory factor (Ser/Thr protein kinase)
MGCRGCDLPASRVAVSAAKGLSIFPPPILPEKSSVCEAAADIHLIDALACPDAMSPKNLARTAPAGAAVWLGEVHECSDIADRLMDVLSPTGTAAAEQRRACRYVIAELSENSFHHAHSPGCYLGAAITPEHFVIAVADLGVGIAHALGDIPEARRLCDAHGDLVRAALVRRVTSRPAFNSGLGLFWTQQLVAESSGELSIHSQYDALKQAGDQFQREVRGERWPGTVLQVRFPRDRPLDLVGLFNRFAPPSENFEFLG